MITFRFSGRTPSPSQAEIGMETDSGAETLRFLLPQVADGQSAQLMMILPDGTPEALLIRDGMATVPASVAAIPGRSRCWVEILGSGGIAWNSELLYLEVGDLPPISEETERTYPTAIQDALDAADQAVTASTAAAAAKIAAERAAVLAGTIGGTLTFAIDENDHMIVTRTIPGQTPIVTDLGDVTAGCVKEAELEEALEDVDEALGTKIDAPESPTTGYYLKWNGSAWVAAALPLYNGGVS
ncbi:MAG: hypothetical protein IJS41_01440 [Clostridia bacterium]|nr:hypothetical protein [Clostridia bacterium]